nr:uncharacterized protein LOC112022985 [Quercus suber]
MPSLTDATQPHIATEIQAMKEQMEVMMNALKGRVSSDLDDLAREDKPRKRERQEEARQDQGRKRPKTGDRKDERRSKPPGGRFTSFTLLTAPIDQVLMQIKNEGALTFPRKLKGYPNNRSRDRYCRFHQDHSHDTADCYDLKQQIEAVIRQGKLQKRNAYRVIQEGSEDISQDGSEGPADGFSAKSGTKRSPVIGFLEEDARCLHHPHDDALIVSLQVGDYNLHRVLVDNGSSADILYYLACQQMGINRERLIPKNSPLVGFGGTRVFPLGATTLSVTAGDYPQQITKDVTFLVVDYSSTYNAILGRPTLNSWKAATLTYHLMIKFPT